MKFFSELKRRNVIRMAGLYLVGAWLATQVAATLLPVFEAPGWVMKVLVALLALGFVPALVFSWVYELTPEGLRRDTGAASVDAIAATTRQRMDRLLMVGMLAVIVVIAANRWWPGSAPEAPGARPDAATSATPGTVQPTATAAGAAAGELSSTIAVLPFVNMSDDPEQGYFSDGITEEIINALVKVPGISVAARTSVFAFKDQHRDVRDIGAQLGVGLVLEGSVRSSGDAIRVTAQLIRVDTGLHLWSEKFDRRLADVFVIQDEIANSIADRLSSSLGQPLAPMKGSAGPAAAARIDAVPQRAASLEAYDLFLRGRTYLRQRDRAQALDWLQRATAADPGFAPAWASLAIAFQSFGDDDEAEPAARKALAIDPDNVDGLIALASVHRDRYQWFEAESLFERARALDPQSSNLLENTAEFYGSVGDFERMLEESSRGFALDPLLAPLRDAHLSALIMNGRLEEALQVALDPDANAQWTGGRAVEILLLRGEKELAVRQIERMADLLGAEAGTLIAALRAPDAAAARATLPAIAERMEAASGDRRVPLVQWVMLWSVAAHLGESQLPLRLALADVAKGDAMNEWIWLPQLAPTRTDPRFKALVRELNLPAWWAERGWPPFCAPLEGEDFECR